MQLHQASNYGQELYNFLSKAGIEGYRADAYVDSVGKPTIGVGYNLHDSATNRNFVLQAFGFDLNGQTLTGDALTVEMTYRDRIVSILQKDYPPTTAGTQQLQNDLTVIMQARAADTNYPSTFIRRTTFAFSTPDEAKTVFDAIIPDYENRVFTQIRNAAASLGKTLTEANAVIDSLKGTEELIALVSLKYTGVNFPATAKAILSDNRAEAWYEIRYGSNSDGGHANRRYAEAGEFGLYDNGGLSITDPSAAKEVMRMYTKHKYEMITYESKYPPSSSGSIDINTEISSAKNYLISYYADWNVGQQTINGDVIVGASTGNYLRDNPNDVLTDTDKNDLILGESGDDTIISGSGNDVLRGGAGNDIYIVNTDGTATIEDKEGNNTLILNGVEIKLLIKHTDGCYDTPDGRITGAWQGTDYIVTDTWTNTKITLNKNFREGDFGIRFQDAPTDPQTNYTITGDLNPLLDIFGNPKVDAWGNIISDGTTSPNRNDTIYDTNGNDRIEGKGGNDTIYAFRGGDDWLLGGDGNDIIDGGTGNDIIEGGAGQDNIYGGDGNDQIFGENKQDMATLVTQGETAQSINQTGDYLVGEAGNDTILGVSDSDYIEGGEGQSLNQISREVFYNEIIPEIQQD